MSKIIFTRKNRNKISFAIVVISLIFSFFAFNNYPVNSQSITGLNAEISSLRSRINRLESEVRNLRTANSAPGLPADSFSRESNSGVNNRPAVVNDRLIGRSDPLSERLATLLIELREDVNDIERRLVILEKQQ